MNKAFILAAGHGKRMRPLTLTTPKPLLKIMNETMLDHALKKLEKQGTKDIFINSHYLSSEIETHLRKLQTHINAETKIQPLQNEAERLPNVKSFKGINLGSQTINLHLSHEEELLDTGGGIQKCIEYFKEDEPFFVLSGDGYWEDGKTPALQRMKEFWDPDKMDILLLLHPKADMHITKGVGDYNLDEQGRATRSLDQSGEYMFTSIRLNKSSIFNENIASQKTKYSYLELMDKAEKNGRLYGLVHDMHWYHISRPEDLEAMNAYAQTQIKKLA